MRAQLRVQVAHTRTSPGSSPGRHVAEPRARLIPSAGPVPPLPRPQRPRSLSSRLALPEAAAEELRRLAPGRTGSTRDVF